MKKIFERSSLDVCGKHKPKIKYQNFIFLNEIQLMNCKTDEYQLDSLAHNLENTNYQLIKSEYDSLYVSNHDLYTFLITHF